MILCVPLGILHVYLLMKVSMYKGTLDIHMMHLLVLGCQNGQNQADGVHLCHRCKCLMIVHSLDLGETFFYQYFLIFVSCAIGRNLCLKHPLALN